MRRIFTLGESLLDIVFKDNVAVSSCPGGAMLNTAVSLGRSGKHVFLISEYGKDHIGDIITDFLNKNKVEVRYVYRYEEKTGIALAFLDQQNESHYSFYKNYPRERLVVDMPDFTDTDILVFGSFYSVEQTMRERIREILASAGNAGALLLYDPNIRKPHKNDLPSIIANIEENIHLADIIRGSHEDFQTIFGFQSAEEVFHQLPSDKIIIYTCSDQGVWLRFKNATSFYPVQKIKTLSTVGAGDSFNAGLICGLTNLFYTKPDLQSLTKEQWSRIIQTACAFAQEVCMSYNNFIAQRSF